MWAIDNNITSSISLKNPFYISTVKGLIGGIFNLSISIYSEKNNLYNLTPLIYLFSLGVISYGSSLVLLIYSMRKIGVARSVLIFGTYPIMSFILSIIFLKEELKPNSFLAFFLTCLAFYLIFKEKHDHFHMHKKEIDSHIHTHNDEHHLHNHENMPTKKHTHLHVHEIIEHKHPHFNDTHHKHH
jgi:drug/metabolite transporter (DMT)-like permease